MSLALGVAALLAAATPTWRMPVLAITLLHFTLHSLDHLLDMGQAEPGWLGSANAIVLGLATAALASLSMQYDNRPHSRPRTRAESKNHNHEAVGRAVSGG